jgi:hypothetical protein
VQRIEEASAELRHEDYVNIDTEFLKCQVELRTLEMGNCDLQQYSHALGDALLQYHSTKMEHINQVRERLLLQVHSCERTWILRWRPSTMSAPRVVATFSVWNSESCQESNAC